MVWTTSDRSLAEFVDKTSSVKMMFVTYKKDEDLRKAICKQHIFSVPKNDLSCRVLSSFCRRSFSTLNCSIIPNEWDPACGQALFLGSLLLAWQRLLRDIAYKVKASLKNAYFGEQMRSNWQENIAAIRHYLRHYQHQHLTKTEKSHIVGCLKFICHCS